MISVSRFHDAHFFWRLAGQGHNYMPVGRVAKLDIDWGKNDAIKTLAKHGPQRRSCRFCVASSGTAKLSPYVSSPFHPRFACRAGPSMGMPGMTLQGVCD